MSRSKLSFRSFTIGSDESATGWALSEVSIPSDGYLVALVGQIWSTNPPRMLMLPLGSSLALVAYQDKGL